MAIPFIVMFMFSSCKHGDANGMCGNDDDSLVVLFTGDVMLDRGVRNAINVHGFTWLFDSVSPMFKQSDAVVINLECPFADTLMPVSKQFVFHADTRWAKALRQSGVTHASMANNHSMDQGVSGIRSTFVTLHGAGIVPMGCGKDEEEMLAPTIIEKNGIRMAVFSAVLFPIENWLPVHDGQLTVENTNVTVLARAIKKWHSQCPNDVIVAYLHWGIEYQTTPAVKQRMAASNLLGVGASAVIGHHPHVVQKMEMQDGKPVFYSLGNFVFDQRHPLSSKAQMARLVVRHSKVDVSSIDVNIKMCKPVIAR